MPSFLYLGNFYRKLDLGNLYYNYPTNLLLFV